MRERTENHEDYCADTNCERDAQAAFRIGLSCALSKGSIVWMTSLDPCPRLPKAGRGCFCTYSLAVDDGLEVERSGGIGPLSHRTECRRNNEDRRHSDRYSPTISISAGCRDSATSVPNASVLCGVRGEAARRVAGRGLDIQYTCGCTEAAGAYSGTSSAFAQRSKWRDGVKPFL